jgi:cytoskeletal protein RodZ
LAVAGVIAAAALATFLALFLTSRPFDPMTSTLDAQQEVPPSALSLQPSPKPSPSASATPPQSAATPATPTEPAGETGAPATDDAAIQTEIERRIAADETLSGLAVSTLVEGGKVSIFGSVGSPELKSRVERVVRSIKGVTAVDNQLVVTQPTP